MPPSTERFLAMAFQAAVLSACESSGGGGATTTPTSVPPPGTTTALEVASGAPAGSVTAPTRQGPTNREIPENSANSAFETISPTALEFGQRCMGKVLSGLKPAKAVDSIDLRLEYFMPAHRLIRAGISGQPCSSAKDPSACRAAYAKVKPAQGGEWLAFSRGDEVGAVNGLEVKDFLVPIETPEEAAVVLVYTLASSTSAAAVLPTCDPSAYRAVSDGFEVEYQTTRFCDEVTKYVYKVSTHGEVSTVSSVHTPPRPGCSPPHMGRRPEGLEELMGGDNPGDPSSAIGEYLGHCAALEAASIPAFRRLACELRQLGAPRDLSRRARRSMRDEIEHARTIRALTRRFGGRPTRIRIAPPRTRTIDDIALENAVEGCVSEAYGALVATWQARHARDAEVRETLHRIADDETRHAALAFDVAAWLAPRLSPEAHQRIAEAQRGALTKLRDGVTQAPSSALSLLGLPSPREALLLVASLEHILMDRYRIVARAQS